MAFPSVAQSNHGGTTTASTTHLIGYPGGSPVADRLYLAIIGFAVPAITPITFTGWTLIPAVAGASISNFSTVVAAGGTHGLWQGYYRLADGTEGADDTLTTNASTKSAWIMLGLSGNADPSVRAPECLDITVGSGSTSMDGGANLSPSGGAKDYLWLSCLWTDGEEVDDDTWATEPAGYSGRVTSTSGTGGAAASNCSIATATKQANASAEDPGNWTAAQALACAGMTVAVHPPSAAFAPPPARRDQKIIVPMLGPDVGW